MSNVEWVFASIGLLGFALLLVSLAFGGHHGGIEAHADVDSGDVSGGDAYAPSWRSLPVISGSLAGFGSGSFLSGHAGVPVLGATIIGLLSMLLLGVVVLVIAGWMSRQQHDSTLSSASYIGSQGQLTLEVPVGNIGQVAFYDGNREYVQLTARSFDGEPLPRGSHVHIVDIAADGSALVSYDPNYQIEEI